MPCSGPCLPAPGWSQRDDPALPWHLAGPDQVTVSSEQLCSWESTGLCKIAGSALMGYDYKMRTFISFLPYSTARTRRSESYLMASVLPGRCPRVGVRVANSLCAGFQPVSGSYFTRRRFFAAVVHFTGLCCGPSAWSSF